MEERRRFGRFVTQLKAQYILKDSKRDCEECTVINMGRKGIGIRFTPHEKVDIGSIVHLEIFVPEKLKPTNVEAVIKWIEKRGDFLFGGIECNELLDEMKFSKLG